MHNAIIGDDNSVTGGVIGAVSLLTVNWIVVRLLFRSPRLNRALAGTPVILIRNGQVDQKVLKREALTREELVEVVHRQGFEHIHDVQRCELEPNGTFYIEGRDPSLADKRHEELLAKIEALVKQVKTLQGTGNA